MQKQNKIKRNKTKLNTTVSPNNSSTHAEIQPMRTFKSIENPTQTKAQTLLLLLLLLLKIKENKEALSEAQGTRFLKRKKRGRMSRLLIGHGPKEVRDMSACRGRFYIPQARIIGFVGRRGDFLFLESAERQKCS